MVSIYVWLKKPLFVSTFLLALYSPVSCKAGSLDSLMADSVKKELLTDTVKKDTSKVPSLVLPSPVAKKQKITFHSLVPYIPPAIFITYGFSSFYLPFVRNVDYSIYNDMQRDHPGYKTSVDNFLQYAPGISVYALNLAGIKGKHSFVDRTFLFALSEGIFGASTFVVKHTSGRTRPSEKNKLSYPSGHTGNAFTAAEFMTQEYGDQSIWYGVAGYAMASATGILRVYNNAHWFSDVIAGAGFGIMSTKLAYAIYPVLQRALYKNKDKAKHAMLMPTYQNGYAGVAYAQSF